MSLAKLKWQCRRGTKELDYLLEGYLIKHYQQATHNEQTLFASLLTFQDTQLICFLLADELPESIELAKLVKQIRNYRNI